MPPKAELELAVGIVLVGQRARRDCGGQRGEIAALDQRREHLRIGRHDLRSARAGREVEVQRHVVADKAAQEQDRGELLLLGQWRFVLALSWLAAAIGIVAVLPRRLRESRFS